MPLPELTWDDEYFDSYIVDVCSAIHLLHFCMAVQIFKI